MTSSQVSIPGYCINEQLYDGSRTLVYRAVRETDSLPVVIKLLKNPYPSFTELVQFRNQYTIAKNLNVPEIIKTYDLEAYQNGYALVMEFGGISLNDYFAFVETRLIASLQEFLEVAIKEVGKKTGLKLAIAKSVVETHNGKLSCNSVLGQGTEFIIEIPFT